MKVNLAGRVLALIPFPARDCRNLTIAGRGLLVPFFQRYSVDRLQPSWRETSSMLGETASIRREISDGPTAASPSKMPPWGTFFAFCQFRGCECNNNRPILTYMRATYMRAKTGLFLAREQNRRNRRIMTA